MNALVLDPHTDAELRSLDAASEVIVDSSRRDAALNSILGEAADSPETACLLGAAPRKRPARRWVALAAAGAVAAAVAGAVVVLPRLEATRTQPAQPSDPTMVTPGDVTLVRDRCVEAAKSGDTKAEALDVLLARRNGDTVSMELMRWTSDHRLILFSCSTYLTPGSSHVRLQMVGGMASWAGMPAVGPRTFTESRSGGGGEHDNWSSVSGELGRDVVAVTVQVDGKSLVATVRDGAYAAWWPSTTISEMRQAAQDGRFVRPPDVTFDLTFADGTVERNAKAFTTGGPRPDAPGGAEWMDKRGPETM